MIGHNDSELLAVEVFLMLMKGLKHKVCVHNECVVDDGD